MKQQTAVEWLVDKIFVKIEKYDINGNIVDVDYVNNFNDVKTNKQYIEKAKEIEKQQIINTYIEGYSAENHNADSEQYYKETFNK